MEHARALWNELGLPPLDVRAPWHGYTLGEWTDTWEEFARRAAAGEWLENGRETCARQRKRLLPETPVREGQAMDE
jgi:4-hydroxy-3-polyprenylbenzoate decarboxylase